MAEAPRSLWDTHSHILPNLDDGPESFDEAVEMIRISAARGVTGIVATPHSLSVLDAGGPTAVHERVNAMRTALAEQAVSLEIAPGMEIRLQPDAARRLTSGEFLPINGTRNALIEFDYTQWANYSESALFDIALAGFSPVLAHVERIVPLQEHPQRVIDFVSRGYYAQITAMSLLGGFGAAPKHTAERLLAAGAIHVVASDTHTTDGNREPWPAHTFGHLEGLVGEEAARLLIYVNPDRIVHGKVPLAVAPRPAKRRRFWLFG